MTELGDFHYVKECLRGHPNAFEPLIDKYQKPIFNAALKMLSNYEDAQDVTQSVFVKAFEKLDSFDPKYKFFSWIYRMVINESINFLKKRRWIEELDSNIVTLDKNPERKLDEIELSERVQTALMKLRMDYRVVIILKHFENLSYREIGYILDIPEKKVKSRLFISRQLLRDILVAKGMTHD